ncbi:MAG: response regulator [Candidatus Margulisiibacteriota bacterium]
MNKILVIDDEYSIRESFSLIFQGKYEVSFAASGEGGMKAAADHKFDLAYLDVRMPGLNGLETLKRLKEIDSALEVVMVTAVNDVQKASEAIALGARDYIIKPFDVQSILKMTETILNRKYLLLQGTKLQKDEFEQPDPLGQSDKINNLIDEIKKKAPLHNRALILGEPGTEKEALGSLFHLDGPMPELPFNTLYLNEGLNAEKAKTLLFGKTKGMTTADLHKTPGIIEETKKGTLFIGNIEYLPSILDSLKEAPSRLVAGSRQLNLAEINKETFEYFSEMLIVIPPLRERVSDIAFLAGRFIEKFNKKHNRAINGLSNKAENVFMKYQWPGNTAELKSVIERAVLSGTRNEIDLEDLPYDLLLVK